MTRLAVLSDIHGNLRALEAVLADIAAVGVPDATWVLGDLAAFCPWPAETLARLRALPGAAFLQGNTDRYLVTGRRPALPLRSSIDWERMPATLVGRDASFRWTVERLSYRDCQFLQGLPAQLEMGIPGYGRILAVHATPANDEDNVLPDTPEDEAAAHLANLDTRLLLYGHTHRPVDRVVGDIRMVNGGSVGLSLDGDPRSAYAVLDFQQDQCEVSIRRVSYDREAVVAELDHVKHPARAWVAQMLRRAAPAG